MSTNALGRTSPQLDVSQQKWSVVKQNLAQSYEALTKEAESTLSADSLFLASNLKTIKCLWRANMQPFLDELFAAYEKIHASAEAPGKWDDSERKESSPSLQGSLSDYNEVASKSVDTFAAFSKKLARFENDPKKVISSLCDLKSRLQQEDKQAKQLYFDKSLGTVRLISRYELLCSIMPKESVDPHYEALASALLFG